MPQARKSQAAAIVSPVQGMFGNWIRFLSLHFTSLNLFFLQPPTSNEKKAEAANDPSPRIPKEGRFIFTHALPQSPPSAYAFFPIHTFSRSRRGPLPDAARRISFMQFVGARGRTGKGNMKQSPFITISLLQARAQALLSALPSLESGRWTAYVHVCICKGPKGLTHVRE